MDINNLDTFIELLVERLKQTGGQSTRDVLQEQMQDPRNIIDEMARADGFPKDPDKQQEEHEDRLAEKTAEENRKMFERVMMDHRKATQPQTGRIIEKLTGLNRSIDRLASLNMESKDLLASSLRKSTQTSDLLDKLVDQTRPKPRKIREDVIDVNVKNLDKLKSKKTEIKPGKLTPATAKSEGMDWMKMLLAGGILAAIVAKALQGLGPGLIEELKQKVSDFFSKGPKPEVSGGAYSLKWIQQLFGKGMAKVGSVGARAGVKTLKWMTNPIGSLIDLGKNSKAVSSSLGSAAKAYNNFMKNYKPPVMPVPEVPSPKNPVNPKGNIPKKNPVPTGKPNVVSTPPKSGATAKVLEDTAELTRIVENAAASKDYKTLAKIKQMAINGDQLAIKALGSTKVGTGLLKNTGKAFLKNIPYFGTTINVGMGEWRRRTGDQFGAGMEYTSAALNMSSGVGGPLGLAAMGGSIAIDVASVARDYYRSQEWERIQQRNEDYKKRTARLIELTQNKDPKDLTDSELEEILGEEGWKEFSKRRDKKNARLNAIDAVKEMGQAIKDEEQARSEMVQELMTGKYGDLIDHDLATDIYGTAMTAALTYSKQSQTDEMRNEYSKAFQNLVKHSGQSTAMQDAFNAYTKLYDPKTGPGKQNHFKGNLKLGQYGDHYIRKDGKLVKVTGSSAYKSHRKDTGEVIDGLKVMELTGERMTKDSDEMIKFRQKRIDHMAPLLGKEIGDNLRGSGLYSAFVASDKKFAEMTQQQVDEELGRMVAKEWTLKTSAAGQKLIPIGEEPEWSKEFKDRLSKMGEGLSTGDAVARAEAEKVIQAAIVNQSAGFERVLEDGSTIYTGSIKIGKDKYSINDVMSGKVDVTPEMTKWFQQSVDSAPGTTNRQIVEAMNPKLRQKLAGYDKLNQYQQRDYDAYWHGDKDKQMKQMHEMLKAYEYNARLQPISPEHTARGEFYQSKFAQQFGEDYYDLAFADDKTNYDLAVQYSKLKTHKERRAFLEKMLRDSGAGRDVKSLSNSSGLVGKHANGGYAMLSEGNFGTEQMLEEARNRLLFDKQYKDLTEEQKNWLNWNKTDAQRKMWSRNNDKEFAPFVPPDRLRPANWNTNELGETEVRSTTGVLLKAETEYTPMSSIINDSKNITKEQKKSELEQNELLKSFIKEAREMNKNASQTQQNNTESKSPTVVNQNSNLHIHADGEGASSIGNNRSRAMERIYTPTDY